MTFLSAGRASAEARAASSPAATGEVRRRTARPRRANVPGGPTTARNPVQTLETALLTYAWAVTVLTALLLLIMAAQRVRRRRRLRRPTGVTGRR